EALAVSDRIIVMNQGVIAQMGAPRELYERPASRFIAGFIGEANLVEGVLGADHMLTIGSLTTRTPHADLAPGPVTVAVRPEAWRIGEVSAGALTGTVVKAAYLGGYCEYTIATVQGEQFVISPDVRALQKTGLEVGLTLGETGIAVLPRN
ncbi:MAG: TOBE domain-containing protein, partial [Betaproteobacteria bacterium]